MISRRCGGSCQIIFIVNMGCSMLVSQIKYPLCFYPVLKQTLWGGNRIIPFLSLEKSVDGRGVAYAGMEHVGECWAVSAIDGFASIVSNGALEGYSLPFLLAVCGEALVGSKNYKRFGDEFPLLVKFIDAAQDLSVQVHPNDELAAKRHRCSGKSEMWYVLDAERQTSLLSGFAKPFTLEQYNRSPEKVMDALHSYNVESGDMFYLPAGTVHSIGSGAFIAEIQQSSDITYRIYDYNRKDKCGNLRELHTELAADAIDYSLNKTGKIEYDSVVSASNNAWESSAEVVSDAHFHTGIMLLDNGSKTECGYKDFEFDYSHLDSFVILICTKGSCSIVYELEDGVQSECNTCNGEHVMSVVRGSVVLLPASLKRVKFRVADASHCELLETHI